MTIETAFPAGLTASRCHPRPAAMVSGGFQAVWDDLAANMLIGVAPPDRATPAALADDLTLPLPDSGSESTEGHILADDPQPPSTQLTEALPQPTAAAPAALAPGTLQPGPSDMPPIARPMRMAYMSAVPGNVDPPPRGIGAAAPMHHADATLNAGRQIPTPSELEPLFPANTAFAQIPRPAVSGPRPQDVPLPPLDAPASSPPVLPTTSHRLMGGPDTIAQPHVMSGWAPGKTVQSPAIIATLAEGVPTAPAAPTATMTGAAPGGPSAMAGQTAPYATPQVVADAPPDARIPRLESAVARLDRPAAGQTHAFSPVRSTTPSAAPGHPGPSSSGSDTVVPQAAGQAPTARAATAPAPPPVVAGANASQAALPGPTGLVSLTGSAPSQTTMTDDQPRTTLQVSAPPHQEVRQSSSINGVPLPETVGKALTVQESGAMSLDSPHLWAAPSATRIESPISAPVQPLPLPPSAMQPPPASQIAAAILSASDGQIDLRLDPVELGRVHLTLWPEGDSMRVHIQADRPETLDLLRRNAGELAAELRTAGYEGTSFSYGGSAQGQDHPPPRTAPATITEDAPATTQPTGTAGALDLRI